MTHLRPRPKLRYPFLDRPVVPPPLPIPPPPPEPEPVPEPVPEPAAVKESLTPGISVILPTRMRPKRLLEAIASIYATAAHPAAVEVVVRMHEDDKPTLAVRNKLPHGCKVVVGPYVDFGNGATVAWEACQAATKTWLWGFSDDVKVHADSKGWDTKVLKLPLTGVIAMPEWNVLGTSKFHKDGATPFFFVPNRWWEKFGFTDFQNPTDAWILGVLRTVGWDTKFIAGLRTLHDRKHDDLMKSEGR